MSNRSKCRVLSIPLLLPEEYILDPGESGTEYACAVCGWIYSCGRMPLPMSGTFTGFSTLNGGNHTCTFCYHFFKTPDMRKKSWVMDSFGVTFFSSSVGRPKDGLLEFIINPPKPPFAIYFTQGYKKQGWLDGINYVSVSSSDFFVHTDWLGRVEFNRAQAEAILRIVGALRSRKINKKEIITGCFSYNTCKKALKGGYEEELTKIDPYKGSPMLEVITHVGK